MATMVCNKKKNGHKIYDILGKEEIFKKIKLTEQYTNLVPSILSYTRKRGPWEQGCIEHQPYCLSFQLSVELHQRFPQQCTAPINTKKWWSFIVSQSSLIICTRSQCLQATFVLSNIVIGYDSCDMWNNQGWSTMYCKCYKWAKANNASLTETLIILNFTKTESNSFIIHCFEENNDKHTVK